MSAPDVSVVLVSYNVRGFVDACLDSLPEGLRDHTWEAFCVDNGSADGSAEHVRARHPRVRVIEMGENAGFARANNRAIAGAGGRHVLLLNCDTVAFPGALDELVRFLDGHPEAGVAAPALLNPDLTDQGTARAFPTPAAAVFGRRSPLTRAFPGNRWSRRYLAGRWQRSRDPFQVDWVSGACMMVPRRVVDAVGGLDEGFFMHWEDADWCRRIKAAGLAVYCVPGSRVVHHEGKSRRGWPATQVWGFHRSVFRYYAKHHLRGWYHPLRPLAAGALAARAGLVILSNRAPAPRRRGPQLSSEVGRHGR